MQSERDWEGILFIACIKEAVIPYVNLVCKEDKSKIQLTLRESSVRDVGR